MDGGVPPGHVYSFENEKEKRSKKGKNNLQPVLTSVS
jgi:hypothetical protein